MKKIKAAVVCDNYKLETFRRILGQAGYEIEEEVPWPEGCTTLKVLADNLVELEAVVRTCERTAKANKGEP